MSGRHSAMVSVDIRNTHDDRKVKLTVHVTDEERAFNTQSDDTVIDAMFEALNTWSDSTEELPIGEMPYLAYSAITRYVEQTSISVILVECTIEHDGLTRSYSYEPQPVLEEIIH